MNQIYRPEKIWDGKYPARPNSERESSLYNKNKFQEELRFMYDGFGDQLFRLRTAKQVSAREMSLGLGHGAGYINNIENKHNYPSMTQFFEICEYLQITPGEFFGSQADTSGLFCRIVNLDCESQELLYKLVEILERNRK